MQMSHAGVELFLHQSVMFLFVLSPDSRLKEEEERWTGPNSKHRFTIVIAVCRSRFSAVILTTYNSYMIRQTSCRFCQGLPLLYIYFLFYFNLFFLSINIIIFWLYWNWTSRLLDPVSFLMLFLEWFLPPTTAVMFTLTVSENCQLTASFSLVLR